MAIDRALARVSSTSGRMKYVRVNVYVRTTFALALRRAAVREGFRVGDFTRMLIMAGMVLRLLTLKKEWLQRIREMNQLLGPDQKRPYSTLRNERRASVWVSVWLPVGFLTFVDQYAKFRRDNLNNALQSFFQLGLQVYLRGKTRLLKAMVT